MDEGALASWRRPAVEHRGGVPARPPRPGRRGDVGGLDRRHRGDRADAAAAAARRYQACAGRRAADAAEPDSTDRRRRDRRPEAGDARPVRAARRRLRADRLRHRRAAGGPADHRRPSRARETSWPGAGTSCWTPIRRTAACRSASPGTSRAATCWPGKVDVIVTDGFTGNVALKTLEGTASYAAAQLRAGAGRLAGGPDRHPVPAPRPARAGGAA